MIPTVFDRAAAAAKITSAAVLFGLMALTFLDVLGRSILSQPIPAAPELTRLGLAVVVFVTLPDAGEACVCTVDRLARTVGKAFALDRLRLRSLDDPRQPVPAAGRRASVWPGAAPSRPWASTSSAGSAPASRC